MEKEQHDHFQKIIQDMMMSSSNETRNRIEHHHNTLIAAQWAEFNYAINTYRNEQRGLIKKDPYHFWVTTEKHRLILMSVVVAYYRGAPLLITKVAKDLGYSTKTVSNVLNEARKLGLLENRNDCKFKPSHHTIDGYVYYTNQAMKLDDLKRLSISVMRDGVGSFQKPKSLAPHPSRVNFRNYD